MCTGFAPCGGVWVGLGLNLKRVPEGVVGLGSRGGKGWSCIKYGAGFGRLKSALDEGLLSFPQASGCV